jgi:hypothetical protein
MSSGCYIGIDMTLVNRFNLRLPDNLRGAIDKRAETHLRSVNNEIVVLLKIGLVNEVEESKALGNADKFIARAKRANRAKNNA